MVTKVVTSACPRSEEFSNLGRTTSIPHLSSMHSSVGADGGVRIGSSTRPKPSSMVLVLDIDECIVHSRAAMAGDRVSDSSFVFETDGVHPQLVHVTLRPHLQEFLREVTSRYETCVFTAGQKRYASPLLDILDPTGTMFSHRFFPEDLTYHDGLKSNVKDLRAAFSKKGVTFDPRRVVLVDNSKANFALNPSNGIPIVDFVGDRRDSDLKDLVHVLRELERFQDVRPVLNKMFHMSSYFVQYEVLLEEEEEEEEEEDHGANSSIRFDDCEDVIMEDVEDEVDMTEDGVDVKDVNEEEAEQVNQVLRRSPRLQNVPRVDYKKYF